MTTLAEVIEAQQQGDELYFFDMSLALACPALFNATRSSRYFPVDFQVFIRCAGKYVGTW